MSNKPVCYIFQPYSVSYPKNHPLHDSAVQLAHNFVVRYNLTDKMTVIRPDWASVEDLAVFHSPDYLNFLSTLPDSAKDLAPGVDHPNFKIGGICRPISEGLFSSCRATAGGTIIAANRLASGKEKIAINWSGGFGEPMADMAQGFGYVNDVALAVRELSKTYKRILCINIGCSHPLGLERGFQDSNKVLTLSFHGNEEYSVNDAARSILNLPLKSGIDNASFKGLFKPILEEINRVYAPEAIILQSRADSLAGDPIGSFNLSVKGHAECLRVLMSFEASLLILGGGGNNVLQAAKLWCYETAVAVGLDPENLKVNGPEYSLVVEPRRVKNMNSAHYLKTLKDDVLECVSRLNLPDQPLQDLPVHISDPKWSGEPIHPKFKYEFTMADQILEALWVEPDGLEMEDILRLIALKKGRTELTRSMEGKVKDKANSLVSQGVLMREGDIFTIVGLAADDGNEVQDRKGKGVMKDGPGFNKGKRGKAKEQLAVMKACFPDDMDLEPCIEYK